MFHLITGAIGLYVAGRLFPALPWPAWGKWLAALLVLLVAGLLVPVPILMLHIVEALVQAYIFGTLALIYIAGGMQSHEASERPEAPQFTDKKGSTP